MMGALRAVKRSRVMTALRGAAAWVLRQEASVLVAAMAVAAGVWVFAQIADEVVGGDSPWIDRAILVGLRREDDPGVPIGPGWMLDAARDMSALGSAPVLILVTLAVIGYLVLERKRHAAWLVVAATLGGMLLGWGLKYAFARERPELVPHLTTYAHPSFPSGHAMNSAVVYLTLAALLVRTQVRRRAKAYVIVVALVVTGLVGVTRVYLGVHYPTDVLAGWTAGAAWAVGCWLAARWLQRRGMVERAGERSAAGG